MNAVHVGSKTGASQERAPVQGEAGLIFEEGGSDEGLEIRREHEVPETEAARRKFFLQEENRRKWEWESGRTYGADFFNGYLDFNGMFLSSTRQDGFTNARARIDLALRLPGFTLPIMKYWDGQGLRFVYAFLTLLSSYILSSIQALYALRQTSAFWATPDLFSRAGKRRSAHTRSDTCSKTAKQMKFFSSSSSHFTSTKIWMRREM
jgi:hypothetical protein